MVLVEGPKTVASNLADILSFLASSVGLKTLDLNRALFAFLALERRPLAITDVNKLEYFENTQKPPICQWYS